MRGKFRMTCMLIGSAAMTNVRRIQHYLAAEQEQENECKETKGRADITWDHKVISFSASLILPIKRLVGELTLYETCFGC
jgi:hypothetical protein